MMAQVAFPSEAVAALESFSAVGAVDEEVELEFEEVDAALRKDDSRGSSSGQEGQRQVSEGSAKALDMAVHDCATRITTAVHNTVVIPLALFALTDGGL